MKPTISSVALASGVGERLLIPWFGALAAILAVSALSTACGGQTLETESASTYIEAGRSPLIEAMGLPDGQSFASSVSEWQAEAQLRIKECMLEEGFTYHVDSPTIESLGRGDIRGYGIADNHADALYSQFEDANTQFFLSLSPEERDAYLYSLFGETADDPLAPYDGPLESQGCTGIGLLVSGGEVMLELDPVTAAFQTEMLLAQSSDEYAVGLVEWTACMAEQGLPGFRNPQQVYDAVGDRVRGLVLQYAPDEVLPIDEIASRLENETLFFEGFEEELEAVANWEIGLEATEGFCTDRHLDEIMNRKMVEIELELLRSHTEEVIAIRETLTPFGE